MPALPWPRSGVWSPRFWPIGSQLQNSRVASALAFNRQPGLTQPADETFQVGWILVGEEGLHRNGSRFAGGRMAGAEGTAGAHPWPSVREGCARIRPSFRCAQGGTAGTAPAQRLCLLIGVEQGHLCVSRDEGPSRTLKSRAPSCSSSARMSRRAGQGRQGSGARSEHGR